MKFNISNWENTGDSTKMNWSLGDWRASNSEQVFTDEMKKKCRKQSTWIIHSKKKVRRYCYATVDCLDQINFIAFLSFKCVTTTKPDNIESATLFFRSDRCVTACWNGSEEDTIHIIHINFHATVVIFIYIYLRKLNCPLIGYTWWILDSYFFEQIGCSSVWFSHLCLSHYTIYYKNQWLNAIITFILRWKVKEETMGNEYGRANQITNHPSSLKHTFPKNRPKSEMLNYNDAHLCMD